MVQNQPRNPDTDVIQHLIEDSLLEFPVSPLLMSLYKQYGQRGFLTKKQMQGLYDKASKVPGIPSGKLATLAAIIKKMPNRFKSELPELKPDEEKDDKLLETIQAILEKYPQHKQVLYLKAKFENNEPLTNTELLDLNKFYKIATKK